MVFFFSKESLLLFVNLFNAYDLFSSHNRDGPLTKEVYKQESYWRCVHCCESLWEAGNFPPCVLICKYRKSTMAGCREVMPNTAALYPLGQRVMILENLGCWGTKGGMCSLGGKQKMMMSG